MDIINNRTIMEVRCNFVINLAGLYVIALWATRLLITPKNGCPVNFLVISDNQTAYNFDQVNRLPYQVNEADVWISLNVSFINLLLWLIGKVDE